MSDPRTKTSKKLSLEAACAMTALLALDDIEAGRIESAKKMLSYLVDERFGQMEEMRAEVKRRLARPSDETGAVDRDLLKMVRRQLHIGHTSYALEALNYVIDGKQPPPCVPCEVAELHAQKAEVGASLPDPYSACTGEPHDCPYIYCHSQLKCAKEPAKSEEDQRG